MIPMIIHQTAPTNRFRWAPVWEKCQESVVEHFQGFVYKLWTDEDLELLIKTKYPWFLQQYLSYPSTIMRVDAARYFVLDTYGGIYIDMDFEIYKNFYSELPQDKVSIVESSYRETEKFQNSLMASPAKHPFWNEVYRELMSTYDYYQSSVLDATGPRMLDRVLERTNMSVHVLPAFQYNPRPGTLSYEHTDNLHSKHYYTAVWVSSQK
jgi:mannosyltransferase OCH1-like enzyme